MAKQSVQPTHSRWKRWAAGAAGLLAVYAIAGFWLVPLLIQHQVPKLGQTELARQATIGEVRFNPFTLRLEVQDLHLAEADGAPLFAIGKLTVELQWKSLIRRAWSFADIRITAPSANLAIAPDGKFNLAELLLTLERRPHEASADTSLPRVVIEQFALEQGRVVMHDRRAGYDNSFSPIDFALNNFSTLPEQNDTHTFTAQSARGGKMRWKGKASVNPIRASGEVTLENASLPELAVYLKSYTHARVAAGQLSATLPYRLSYAGGKFEAALEGAKVSLRDLALAREGVTDSFATLTRLDVSDVNADLASRQMTVGEVRVDAGKLSVKRDAKGELDLANLMIAAAGPKAASGPPAAVAVNNWKLAVKQVLIDQVAISAVDETATPPLKVDAGKVRLQLQVAAEQAGANFQLKLSEAAFSLADLTIASGAQTPFRLAQLGFTDGSLDLAARQAGVGRLYAEGGQLQIERERDGKLNLMALLPRYGGSEAQAPAPVVAPGKPWVAVAKTVELSKFGADVADHSAGVKVQVTDLALTLEGASSDLKRPVKFNAGLGLREGGQFAAQGSVVPASGELQADVRLKQLALAPLQPLLAHYLKLKIARGNVSAQGRLSTGAGTAKSPRLRYVGALNVAGLTLNEVDGGLFAAWKNASADKFTASLNPNRLDVPELRIVEPNATLIIEDDRSFNAARLLVRPDAADPKAVAPTTPTKAADDPFPVRIRRLRLQNAKLDFTDLSLRPQFSAKIYELNGVINGLSSNREARSQIELDGRVDEFGLARIRGELNPFAPRNNTDINVVFKNVDMVATSPYTMKFAGYKVAEGKISLDLQYKLRDSQLEGSNQIVIDKLTLGERVDSPDALKLPLQLAIAILKDSDGRIELGLPISGNLSDPQFSYGAIIWKAIGNLLSKIVTAPFRALGNLLGVQGEKLESIDFDAGSAKLLPPEREKLKQVGQILAKRAQLKLSVPGQYSEAADGAALRARAVRVEITRRAGIKLQAGEEPGPVDLGDRALRGAMRDLYAERFGEAELNQQKKAAEGGAAAPAAAASLPSIQTEAAQAKLPIWQRVSKLIQGEPQVADASAFYNQLQQRLNQNQPLAADVLATLGAQRAAAILAALQEAGVAPARVAVAAPEKVESDVGKPVPLKLGLAAQ
ncbi:MAG: DUF748 domain-containing protein [Rhodoferax sp.]|uniref:DUF748 domain-containing protein n=1 Tax=Rhodoferax sp. TaxID=50421 RepID=UPI0013FE8180|nr:DUF748 domain-containing protein [Rhodoferax sp.]NDP39834.1 DUF748 domain-containing protein [Rhodoferax sp.]